MSAEHSTRRVWSGRSVIECEEMKWTRVRRRRSGEDAEEGLQLLAPDSSNTERTHFPQRICPDMMLMVEWVVEASGKTWLREVEGGTNGVVRLANRMG